MSGIAEYSIIRNNIIDRDDGVVGSVIQCIEEVPVGLRPFVEAIEKDKVECDVVRQGVEEGVRRLQ